MTKATVYYWRGRAEARQDIISALEASDFKVVEHLQFESILDRFSRDRPVLLVVDTSAGEREAGQMELELKSTAKLYSLPILFISTLATKRVEGLRKRFAYVVPVDVPYLLSAVMQGIELITEDPGLIDDVLELLASSVPSTEMPARDPEREVEKKEEAVEEVVSEEADASEELAAQATAEVFAEVFKEEAELSQEEHAEQPRERIIKRVRPRIQSNDEEVRKRMRANPNPARLQGSYGGEAFAVARKSDDFIDEALLPQLNKEYQVSDLVQILGKTNPWLETHAKRSTFVSAAMASYIKIPAERERDLRVASLFLNWSLRDRPPGLLRYDILKESSDEMRQVIAEAYGQSARIVGERFSEERAANIIWNVSRLIKQDMSEQDSSLSEDSEILLSVELSGRSCWTQGFWNPVGAYRAMRYFRSAESPLRRDTVKNQILKVLGEAVTVHVTVGNLFCSLDDDTEFSASSTRVEPNQNAVSAVATKAQELNMQISTVQVADLAPGMLLAYPVVSLDGRLILDANVLLNEDLVFDLWQLAAIRAIPSRAQVLIGSSH